MFEQKYLFGDFVIVEENLVGIVLKTWQEKTGYTYEVYVRSFNTIKDYEESEIERYKVRHKELDETELEYQNS